MSSTGYIFNGVITTTILLAFNANAAAPTFNIQLGLAVEDFEGQQETYKQLTGSVRYNKGLTRHSVLNLNADLFTRKYNDNDWRNSDGVLGEIIYSYIPSNGFTKPVYSLALRQEFEKFDDASSDSTKTSLILADTIRLDDQVTFTAGLEISTTSSDLRDITKGGLFLNTDVQINSTLIVYINLKIEDESIETNSSAIALVSQISARNDFAGHHDGGGTIIPDPSLPGSSTNPNFDSENVIVTLGTNYIFTSNQSVDASYEYNQYALTGNVDIHGSVISLDYFYKF